MESSRLFAEAALSGRISRPVDAVSSMSTGPATTAAVNSGAAQAIQPNNNSPIPSGPTNEDQSARIAAVTKPSHTVTKTAGDLSHDRISKILLDVVSELTGYPVDMLKMDISSPISASIPSNGWKSYLKLRNNYRRYRP